MKKIFLKLLSLTFSFIVCLNVVAQQTSLTIDNQTPGWLSSKIGYEDQQTVENLKVIGYLNGTDINFLVLLQSEYNLRALDLSEVNIVKGGEKVFVSNYREQSGYNYYDRVNEVNIADNNILYSWLFLPFTKLQKLTTPKSAVGCEVPIYINADTVILNGQFNKVEIQTVYDGSKITNLPGYQIKSLELTEGIDTVVFRASSRWIMKKLVLPSSIKYLGSVNITGGNIFSRIDYPEQIIFNSFTQLVGDTIFIPEGTTERYKNSKFKNMKVFVEMNAPTTIQFTQPRLIIYRGETKTLLTTTEPEDVYYKELEWESSDENIAAVNQNGEVMAVAPGTAVISVSSVKNPEAKAQCEVTVCDHTTGIEMASTEERVNIGSTIALVANTLPLGTSDNMVNWSTDNKAIATVDGMGNVTGIKLGSCVITATSVDGGYSAECNITVVQPAKAVTLNKHETSIVVNNSETLKTTVNPENTTDKTVIWSTSNADIAEVSDNGLVTAKKAGKVFVTAVAVSNQEAKDSCEVTVLQPVEDITLDQTSIIIEEFGQMVKLNATILPEDASNKSISWSSSNPAVCTVSANGTVIAVGNGTATVIATTVDGGIPATCVVNVKDYFCDTNRDGVVDVADIAVIIDKMAGRARLLNETKE